MHAAIFLLLPLANDERRPAACDRQRDGLIVPVGTNDIFIPAKGKRRKSSGGKQPREQVAVHSQLKIANETYANTGWLVKTSLSLSFSFSLLVASLGDVARTKWALPPSANSSTISTFLPSSILAISEARPPRWRFFRTMASMSLCDSRRGETEMFEVDRVCFSSGSCLSLMVKGKDWVVFSNGERRGMMGESSGLNNLILRESSIQWLLDISRLRRTFEYLNYHKHNIIMFKIISQLIIII